MSSLRGILWKFLERVLRDCEDELAFSLCRVDPAELCNNSLSDPSFQGSLTTTLPGVDEYILVIRHACYGIEGEYTCQVSLQDKHVFSEPSP